MGYVLSHNVFDRVGDRWNAHPEREQVSTGLVIRKVEGPSWSELTHHWQVEGYGVDGEPTRVEPKRGWVDPVKVSQEGRNRLLVEMRNENAPKARAPEYRRVVEDEIKGRHPEAKDVVLTPEMLLKRKRQRAAVQARLTRAKNREKRIREELMNRLLTN